MARTALLVRCALCLAVLAAATGGLKIAAERLFPEAGGTVRGLRVAGEEVPAGSDPRAVAEARAEALLARTIQLTYQGDTLLVGSARELGGHVDTASLARHIARVGHEADLFRRLDSALRARDGAIDIPMTVHVSAEPLAERLSEEKEARDRQPTAARLNVSSKEVTEHRSGLYLDVYTAAQAVQLALANRREVADVEPFEVLPSASSDLASTLEVDTVVSHFETRFSYGKAGRSKNIERASQLMDGVILMPGESISFNQIVGARSVENGFHSAPEIYRGEMRDGIGGGTCQVASTLHAAAFFAGLDVVERRNHSRPSGYIRPGLDATVSYPVLDLKLENPFTFPLVIHSEVDPAGIMRFELRGPEKTAEVQLRTETIGISKYKRKVRRASWLGSGEYKLEQRGKRGMSIRRVRVIQTAAGGQQIEESTDVYPPTTEIYLLAPGDDEAEVLPPLLDGPPSDV